MRHGVAVDNSLLTVTISFGGDRSLFSLLASGKRKMRPLKRAPVELFRVVEENGWYHQDDTVGQSWAAGVR